MRTVEIEVTQRDIKTGQRRNRCRDPIAKATLRRLDSGTEVFVNARTIEYRCLGKIIGNSQLPETVYDFIQDYDRGKEVAPFSFQLEIPDEIAA